MATASEGDESSSGCRAAPHVSIDSPFADALTTLRARALASRVLEEGTRSSRARDASSHPSAQDWRREQHAIRGNQTRRRILSGQRERVVRVAEESS